MIKSMTAYGRSEYKLNEIIFVAEIRSYNNRHRDIILRMPNNFKVIEKDLRSIISSKVRRGRIEVSIQIEKTVDAAPYNLELNLPLVKSYLKVFNQLAEQFGLQNQIRAESFCQMKDVIIARPEEMEVDKLGIGFHEVLNQALDSLDAMRKKEGEAIEADFLKRLDLLEKYAEEINERAPFVVKEYQIRLTENIQNILKDLPADESRIAQEVAFFAERADITEEIVRIRSHLSQFRSYLLIDEALGRRLDFLVQELGREVNTIGAKASDSIISKVVVEMKAELEKLREQIQNVE